jgi:rhodanese-related sulfurtransferase
MSKVSVFRDLTRLVPGMGAIVALAAGIGFTFNGLSPNGLPLVRKPLRETRRFVTAPELLSHSSSRLTRGSASSAAAPACNTIPDPASRKSSTPVSESTQNQLSNTKQRGSTTTADPWKATPNPTAAQTKISAPVAPNQTHLAVPVTEVKGVPQQSRKDAQALFTTLDDAKALFDKNAAIFLDGRPAVDYEVEHIQGAVSLFTEDVDNLCAKVLGNVPKDKVIVTYCSDPECVEAMKLADALVAKGFTKVVILLEGLPGWKEAGYPTAKAKESV